jgi:hypothetical protein
VRLDPEASRELSEAREQALDAEQQLAELDSALTMARARLAKSQAEQARKADRVQAALEISAASAKARRRAAQTWDIKSSLG